jgi:signal transduction histidine kinase/ligand-binding sensor domain-containing protein
MKKYIVLLPVVCSLLLTGITFSQQPKFNLVLDNKTYNLGFVYSITQDQKGLIWFTSVQKGLQRYDGKKLTAYSHNSENPNSLASNMATAVSVDSSGHIWVGTMGSGLDRFDPETKKFTHFRHEPGDPTSLGSDTLFAITTDRSGNTWIGTNRTIDKFNPATGKFTHYIIDELFNYVYTSEDIASINAIYEDRKGNLWVGWGDPFAGKKEAVGGLARLDKATGKFIQYKHNPTNPNSLADNNVFSIYEDSKNNFWVCTRGNGLQTLDRVTGKFTNYNYDANNPERLSRPPFTGSQIDFTTFITEDAKGKLWIGSFTGGINMYDPVLKKTIHFGSVSNDKTNRYAKDTLNGFTDSMAFRAFSSKDGLLWITSGNGSIYNVDLSRTTVPFVSLNGAAGAFYYEEDKNVLWIQSDSGIIRKNLLTNQEKLFKHDPRNVKSLANKDVMAMQGDGEGNIWMATHWNGIEKFNIKTEQFTHIRHDKNNPASLVHDSTHTLFFDRQNYLWIGTHKGLSRMDIKTGSCTNYINDPKDSLSVGKGHINSIAQDKNDMIWIGTDDDMYALDIKTGKFQRHKVGGGQIVNICIDETGKIWAAGSGGLYFLDKQKNSFKKFTTQAYPDGFEDVWGIVEDDKGNLWLSTNKNIIKINKERDAAKIFGAAQGVQPITGMWMENIRTKDGRLFLGSLKGYYSFKPDELIDERTAPILNFSNFKIGNEEMVVGEGTVLTSPIWKTNSIKLGYWQNTISFEFEAIDYKSQGEIKYLYKLENYDNEWRDIGTEHKATFFNLPHGKYILHIKAVNSDGAVAQKSMAISITAPWWKTWWAFCLYAILVIVAGYLIYKYQKYYIVKRERERTQQKELAQAKEIEIAYTELKATQAQLIQSEKMASLGELTAGIAHEIQNPLNFVNNFSEVNTELIEEMKEQLAMDNKQMAMEIADDIKENEQKILHHGKRADAIVKGMLQHSRSSSGVKEPTDINALCDEYLRLSYHGLRAKDKSFNATMKTDFDETIGNINIIPQDIGRVILNLITNAFYVVDEKKKAPRPPEGGVPYDPTVSVSTKKVSDKVLISVKDNGPGIPQKILDKIFQPFFTTKPTGQGTGLGLSLSYDIVKAHGGELKVETKEAEGSKFIIVLPFNK